MARYTTAGDIINRAAREVGLGAVVDPFQSSDTNFQQLVGLLTSCGEDLVKTSAWPHLVREYIFDTVSGTMEYALPADFMEMLDQSGWNRTSQEPLGNPLSPQTWQYLKASPVTGTLNVLFRLGGIGMASWCEPGEVTHATGSAAGTFTVTGKAAAEHVVILTVYDSSGDGGAINAGLAISVDGVSVGQGEYLATFISAATDPSTVIAGASALAGLYIRANGALTAENWGFDDDQQAFTFSTVDGSEYGKSGQGGNSIVITPAPTSAETIAFEYRTRNWVSRANVLTDSVAATNDVVLFDPLLAIRALKLAWKTEKGFATDSAMAEYAKTLEECKGHMRAAPVLSLNGSRIGPRMLDGGNLPDTGFGS
ncbi:MAG TPA: hypothetical protein DCP69_10585 [Candidatus Omnitrophica bacterium]|nr:hypothetical protein [Candidatus Omnitrophota bacterium]